MSFRKRLFTSTSAVIVKLNDISLTLDIREVIVVSKSRKYLTALIR